MFEHRGGRIPQGQTRLRVSVLSFLFLLVGGFAAADTLVSGAIATNTTWTLANSPYLMTGHVFVQGTGTPVLTIEAGVTVKANESVALLVGYSGAGNLQAVGTATQPIVFTSSSGTSPGFWEGLRFYSGAVSASRVSYATVSYGGGDGLAGIYIDNCSPTIDNVTVQSSAQAGIKAWNGASPTISNTTVTGAPWGLWSQGGGTAVLTGTTLSNNTSGGIYLVSPSGVSLQTATISNNTGYAISADGKAGVTVVSGLTVTGNASNAIERRASTIDVSTTWANVGLPYVMTGHVFVQGAGTPVLRIQAGVMVKAKESVALLVGYSGAGNLQAVGTATQPIVFTSSSGTSPGFWEGLRFYSGAVSASRVSYATVSYGGADGFAGIYIDSCAPSIDHVRLDTNAVAGVRTRNPGTGLSLANCDFVNNPAGLTNSTPTSSIIAQLNWWSSTNGPSGSGPGTGQSVSAGVQYEPWLLAAGSSPQYVASFALSNSTFNPSIGVNAVFTFTTSLTGNWSVTIFDSTSAVVRTITGSGITAAATWDGKNGVGVDQPNGNYTYRIDSAASGSNATSVYGRNAIDRARQLIAQNVVVSPQYFSPNGDGVQDTSTLSGTSSFDGATWTINVKNSSGTVVRTASGGPTASISFTWDGKNSSGAVQSDGPYSFELALTDGAASAGATGSATLDNTVPGAAITSPAAATTLSNVYQTGSPDVPVVGTATDANLQSWQVDFGTGPTPGAWTTIATGTGPVSSASFGTWPTYGLTNGTYTVRLQVWDRAGNKSTIPNTLTVGNFKVAQDILQLNGSTGAVVRYTSTVPFNLTETLMIKNLAGQTVRTISLGSRNAGTYTDNWDGKNNSAQLQPDGAYFVVATATAGASSMTHDLTNQYLNDYSAYLRQAYDEHQPFQPFNNKPLTISWSYPQPSRVWALYTTDGYLLDPQNHWPVPEDCARPGNFCLPNGEYQESGPHSTTWAGVGVDNVFRTDIVAVGGIGRRDEFSKNAVVLFGTKPTLTNLGATPAVFSPGSISQTIAFDTTSFQSQNLTVTVTIMNQESQSILRTIVNNASPPGHVSIAWDGRADNGMWVAPGSYTITATVQDGLGNTVRRQILTSIFY